jgi:DNA repair ATPase RecN
VQVPDDLMQELREASERMLTARQDVQDAVGKAEQRIAFLSTTDEVMIEAREEFVDAATEIEEAGDQMNTISRKLTALGLSDKDQLDLAEQLCKDLNILDEDRIKDVRAITEEHMST